VFSDLPTAHPGCLIASICYQECLFDREVRAMTAGTVQDWNRHFHAKIAAAAGAYPARDAVDAMSLAMMLSCVIDGAIIMGKALSDPSILPRQILLVRSYIKLLFQPALAEAKRPTLAA